MSQAKLQHQQLFESIALRNSEAPAVPQAGLPLETAAVANNREQFQQQFQDIAAEHAR